MNIDWDWNITLENKKRIILGIAVIAFIIALVLIIAMLPSEGNQSGKAWNFFSQTHEDNKEQAETGPSCPADCSDKNGCTIDYCNSETEYTCSHIQVVSVECGTMCPASCNDNIEYTRDYCSGETNYQCRHEDLRECVSNFCWYDAGLNPMNSNANISINETIFVNKNPIRFESFEDLDYGIYLLRFTDLKKLFSEKTLCSVGDFELECKFRNCDLTYDNATGLVTFKNSDICKVYR